MMDDIDAGKKKNIEHHSFDKGVLQSIDAGGNGLNTPYTWTEL